MLLGLAALTVAAHVLTALAHAAGGHSDWRDWPLLMLLALAPIGGVMLASWGRPRHGAVLLALTMGAAAWYTLYSHFWLASDVADPKLYGWLILMQLAFELQGGALGLMLIVKPQVPRPKAEGTSTG